MSLFKIASSIHPPRLIGLWILIVLNSMGFAAQAQHPDIPPEDDVLSIYKALLPRAQAGEAEIQTTLGIMRLKGEWIPRDLKVARIWLGKAALQNYPLAQYHLGRLLVLDVLDATLEDLNKQLAEGLHWLRRASREQHPAAQLLYAQTILESTLDNPFGHSKSEAQQHLNACAIEYLPCTYYALTRLDQDSSNETCFADSSCEQKKSLLFVLANAADRQAMYRLANFENEERLFWLRRAARLNHPQASVELARQVLNNEVRLEPQDPAVMALLNNAAEQGLPDAMFLLGSLLYEGKRFPVNKSLGLQWLKLAAQKEHSPSIDFLAHLKSADQPNALSPTDPINEESGSPPDNEP